MISTSRLLCAFTLIAASVLTGDALRAEYSFTTIADSDSGLSPDYTSLGQRKINDSGEVAFLAQPSFAQYRIYKTDGDLMFTHIAGPPNFFGLNRTGNGAITNSGEVVFTGSTASFANGIFRGTGTSISTIAFADNDTATPGPKRTFFATSVSNSGHVAYGASSWSCSGDPATCTPAVDGYYANINGSTIPLAEAGDTWSSVGQFAPAINDSGQAVFTMTSALDNQVHLLRHDGESLTTIHPDFAGGKGYSINNAGDVAFTEPTAIKIFSNGTTNTIASTDDGFNGLMKSGTGEVFINDAGRVAFWGSVDTYQSNPVHWQGIFTGPDVVADRVLVSGDVVLGHTISSVELLGMNNSGQILMGVTAASPDSWRALLVATPPAAPALSGDYNDDGSVDAADYVLWRKHAGTSTVLPNDSTAGTVDDNDFLVWQSNFGSAQNMTLESTTAPEPTTSLLVAWLLFGIPLHCRRTR